MGVIVLGSANHDTSVSMPRIPAPGETILATGAASGPGGKGLNQAVAAARSGASTTFVGAVGDDEAGERLRGVLIDEGVRAGLGVSERPTGTAFVMVADDGENAIVVVAGANGDGAAITGEAASALASAGSGDLVLAQLEVPLDAVLSAFRSAKERGATTVLNAAPSRPLSEDQLALVDVLIVNQHECLDLAGAPVGGAADAAGAPVVGVTDDAGAPVEGAAVEGVADHAVADAAPVEGVADDAVADAARFLAARVGTVVVTLGAAGALVLSAGEETRIPAFPVTAVDTTAAGDTFCGALASRLAAGDALAAAVPFASAAAALCVQRPGAAASAPRLDEITELLATRA
ncbi:ribokinase [Microbacterium sp. MYb72]|uniref:ribokinase n=1 Tax=Microbacterium sp. MYb72 TaxID=1848693 RepID=UPI000CFBA91F|nr:ribokinase [Microbacterium sp. MYb72]PRB05509.1 ribokinase [Microbacterium sp. MYb72]